MWRTGAFESPALTTSVNFERSSTSDPAGGSTSASSSSRAFSRRSVDQPFANDRACLFECETFRGKDLVDVEEVKSFPRLHRLAGHTFLETEDHLLEAGRKPPRHHPADETLPMTGLGLGVLARQAVEGLPLEDPLSEGLDLLERARLAAEEDLVDQPPFRRRQVFRTLVVGLVEVVLGDLFDLRALFGQAELKTDLLLGLLIGGMKPRIVDQVLGPGLGQEEPIDGHLLDLPGVPLIEVLPGLRPLGRRQGEDVGVDLAGGDGVVTEPRNDRSGRRVLGGRFAVLAGGVACRDRGGGRGENEETDDRSAHRERVSRTADAWGLSVRLVLDVERHQLDRQDVAGDAHEAVQGYRRSRTCS